LDGLSPIAGLISTNMALSDSLRQLVETAAQQDKTMMKVHPESAEHPAEVTVYIEPTTTGKRPAQALPLYYSLPMGTLHLRNPFVFGQFAFLSRLILALNRGQRGTCESDVKQAPAKKTRYSPEHEDAAGVIAAALAAESSKELPLVLGKTATVAAAEKPAIIDTSKNTKLLDGVVSEEAVGETPKTAAVGDDPMVVVEQIEHGALEQPMPPPPIPTNPMAANEYRGGPADGRSLPTSLNGRGAVTSPHHDPRVHGNYPQASPHPRPPSSASQASDNVPPGRGFEAEPMCQPPNPSSSSMEPSNAGRPANSNDVEWQKIKNKQQRLLLLHHAYRCPHKAGECTTTPHCAMMKKLREHIAQCKNQHCTVQHCISSRYVLAHYRRCKDAQCPACGPVREKIKKSQDRSKQQQPVSSSHADPDRSRSSIGSDDPFNRPMASMSPSPTEAVYQDRKRPKMDPAPLPTESPHRSSLPASLNDSGRSTGKISSTSPPEPLLTGNTLGNCDSAAAASVSLSVTGDGCNGDRADSSSGNAADADTVNRWYQLSKWSARSRN
jgi:TAZ zinc finger